MKTYPNINEATATGNTALHAAANLGNPGVTGALLTIKGIHINTTNPQCEDATPLHLAVMHGKYYSLFKGLTELYMFVYD